MGYSVVILSKNAANLDFCLASIDGLNPGCPVIVVDDGVGQQISWTTRESLESWPHYVPGAKPFIFARNANIGIAAAGEDDVILLNDDALLQTPHGFDVLAAVARDTDFGIIAPATSGVGNENQNYLGYHHLREEPKVLCFVCVYIRRDALNRLGPLDERYVAYGWDDNDYCRRAINAGYKLGIYDPVQVEHGKLKSSFRGHGHCDMTANQRIYEEKWGRP
jgi:GT2 family glycosyltransferase